VRRAILLIITTVCALPALVTEAKASRKPAEGEPPAVVKAVAPSSYPRIAKAARAEGKVTIEASVNAAGEVTATRRIGGHALLLAASETAAKAWRFAPARAGSGGRTVRLTFMFRLADGDGDTISFLPPYEVEIIGRAAPHIDI
jgi:TonB family protein